MGHSAREEAFERDKEITRELNEQILPGRWPHVLSVVLPELQEAIDKNGKKVYCPWHQKNPRRGDIKDLKISVKNFANHGAVICTCNPHLGDGFKVIMYARNCSFKEARQAVIDALGGNFRQTRVPVVYVKELDPDAVAKSDARLKKSIERYWNESVPLDHPKAEPARNWLRMRGLGELKLPIASLRCHPALTYYEDNQPVGKFPALIGMVRDVNLKTSTIHRTYLSSDGASKALVGDPALDEARKQYPAPSTHPVNGCAIKFSAEEHPVLNVAEGIETALSAMLLMQGLPTWSTLNKDLLSQLEIPSYVKILIVWGDRDRSRSGQAVTVKLVDRARQMGIRAVGFLPPYGIPADKKGIDWNDVIRKQGVATTRMNLQFLALQRQVNAILREIGHSAGKTYPLREVSHAV